jgi:hypothetical protein
MGYNIDVIHLSKYKTYSIIVVNLQYTDTRIYAYTEYGSSIDLEKVHFIYADQRFI